MKLPIAKYGNPILRAKGKHIAHIDDEIRELAFNMLETMHGANGVGLAAQQIGQALQLTVVDVSQVEDRPSTMKLNAKEVDPVASMPLILINPELEMGEEQILGSEGCLSIPDINADVLRAFSVKARARNLEDEEIELEATGLLARALQHEVDHLNGILFIDRISSAAKASLASRLKRMQKENRMPAGGRCSGACARRRNQRQALAAASASTSDHFVIDGDGAVEERVALRRKIEKLEHRAAHHPLITDQSLNHIRVRITRARH